MLLKLAWRNIWRNTRRTLITLAALTLGCGVIIGMQSYSESAYGRLIRDLTTQMVGHLQVHGKGWQAEPSLENVVENPRIVEAAIAGSAPGAVSTRRVIGAGLAGSAQNSSGVMVLGLQPDRDDLLTVVRGEALDPAVHGRIALGSGVASMLEVEPGGEVVLVGQAADGSVANDRYTVAAVVEAGSVEMSATTVFLTLADAQDFFSLGEGVHQVIVRLPTDDEDISDHVATMRAALDLHTLEALTWAQILPELRATIDSKRSGLLWINIVVLLIVGLGVLNTMTMATFERTRELGVMMSLGTRRGRVLGLVVTESLLQGALGFVLGAVLGIGVILAIGELHFGAVSTGDMLGVRLPSTLPLHIKGSAVVGAGITALFTTLLGGLWPALRASRLPPAEATRYV
ncbi:MAG: ABC transporter permease [Deltaproteobacteria bacterium]|nr:ABC transporter permease [Deltaproteobacteria bacterium]